MSYSPTPVSVGTVFRDASSGQETVWTVIEVFAQMVIAEGIDRTRRSFSRSFVAYRLAQH